MSYDRFRNKNSDVEGTEAKASVSGRRLISSMRISRFYSADEDESIHSEEKNADEAKENLDRLVSKASFIGYSVPF